MTGPAIQSTGAVEHEQQQDLTARLDAIDDLQLAREAQLRERAAAYADLRATMRRVQIWGRNPVGDSAQTLAEVLSMVDSCIDRTRDA